MPSENTDKIIYLNSPVIVRDFATALGLKPFKIISELMEMGIFASMNQTIEDRLATLIAAKHGFLLKFKPHTNRPHNSRQTDNIRHDVPAMKFTRG